MMTEKIKHLLETNEWERKDTQDEVTKCLERIKEYAEKALAAEDNGSRSDNVDWMNNYMKHLREAQDKLNNLAKEKTKLEWILKEDA
jgi:hypothetical protein